MSIYPSLLLVFPFVLYLAVQKQVLAAADLEVEEMAMCLEPGLSPSFFSSLKSCLIGQCFSNMSTGGRFRRWREVE